MSWEFCRITTQKARKDYSCDASLFIADNLSEVDFTEEEKAVISKHQQAGWKILKGTEYIKCSGKWEGEWCDFIAIPELDAICQKYKLYIDF